MTLPGEWPGVAMTVKRAPSSSSTSLPDSPLTFPGARGIGITALMTFPKAE